MVPTQMAVIFNTLMKRLGITKYYVQGGDWGSVVADQLASFYPETLLGIHLNFCLVNNARAHLKMMISSLLPSFFVEEQLVDNLFPLYDRLMFVLEETGYMHIQGTKPDTLGKIFVRLNVSMFVIRFGLLQKRQIHLFTQLRFRRKAVPSNSGCKCNVVCYNKFHVI